MGILDKGVDFLRAGENEKAVKYFLEASLEFPNNDGIFRFLGKSYALIGNRSKAYEAIENAININPEQPMWLYKLLAENKLDFIYIEDATEILEETIAHVLMNPESIEKELELYGDEALCSTSGDGQLGNKIICKAIQTGRLEFISPIDGKKVSTNHSLVNDAYYFKEGNYILSFFSDWANPFLFYQIYLIDKNTVVFGYLDKNSELHTYNKKPHSFIMYYANLLMTMAINKKSILSYLNTPINKVILSNQNFKHLGHAIWNGVSATNPLLYKKIIQERDDIAITPQATVLPNYTESIEKIAPNKFSGKYVDDTSVYRNNVFKLSVKANYVHESTANQIIDAAFASLQDETISEIRTFRKKHFPIILIGLRCGTRSWENQKEGYRQLMSEILIKHPNAGFIIDGMNSIESEMHSSHENIDLSEELEIAKELIQVTQSTHSLVGVNVNLSFAWGEIVDLFIAPWGAGLAKYKWVNNIKGVVYSSKCVLAEKNDLHIYDDEKYREFAVKDIWLTPSNTTNSSYDTLADYKKMNPTGNAYYYQNFNVDLKGLSKITLEYLNNLSPFMNEFKYKSLKNISNIRRVR